MRFTQACTLSASQTTDNSVLSNIMLPWLCLQAVREVAAPGAHLGIKLDNGRTRDATVVSLPFYDPGNQRQEM